MSMNLHCNKIDLWQTPTHITYMCMINNDGKIEYELTGKKALRALYIYIEWVKGLCDGVWKKDEDLKNCHDRINFHKKELNEIFNLNSYRTLKVYIM